jgi:hypothetical protein
VVILVAGRSDGFLIFSACPFLSEVAITFCTLMLSYRINLIAFYRFRYEKNSRPEVQLNKCHRCWPQYPAAIIGRKESTPARSRPLS